MENYNREEIRLVFGLGCIFCDDFDVHESSLFIELITFNDNAILNTLE